MAELWVIGIEEDDGDGEDWVDRTYHDYHLALSAEGPLLCSYTGKRVSSEQVDKDMDLWETWPCSECMVVLASRAETAEARVAELEKKLQDIRDGLLILRDLPEDRCRTVIDAGFRDAVCLCDAALAEGEVRDG